MKITNRILTALLLLVSITTNAQLISEEATKAMVLRGNESEMVMQSSTLTQEGYLYYASLLADKLVTMKPESSNYNYRKGFLMLSVYKDYENAIYHFEKAILDTDPNFDMYSHKETSAPTDAYFHLATCYHLNEDIDKAEENYNKFINLS